MKTINLELTQKDRLLPCPFCGHGGDDLTLNNTWTACYWIACDNCSAEVHGESFGGADGSGNQSVRAHQKAKASALAKWNTRAIASAAKTEGG